MTLTSSPERAAGTTWLFVPGSTPQRFGKAAAAGADQVILDLEDAVATTEKERARAEVVDWLTGGGHGWVRINAAGTDWHLADVAALAAAPGLRGVLLAKAESVATVTALRERLAPSAGVVALIETARGVRDAYALADSGHVDRFALGAIDLALDLGAEESDESLLLARSTLVLASRAAGLLGPIDGVTTVTGAPDPVTSAAGRARALGFAGKLCIHPRQVDPARAGFAATYREVAWAERVTAAVAARGDDSAFALDGEMVDLPVVLRARDVLARRTTTA